MTNASDLFSELDHIRGEIDAILEDFLSIQRREFVGLGGGDPSIFDALSRFVASGGKRLRPVLCYLAYLAAGGDLQREGLRAAASLELLHSFALIHDDLMDRSETRRGRATIHMAEGSLRRPGARLEAEHFGISAAILAGDLAFVLSDLLLARSGFPPTALAEATIPLYEMRTRAIGGQWLDILGAPLIVSPREARRIARLKTTGYSVEGPLLVGAALAHAAPSATTLLSEFAEPLGEALQMIDDAASFFEGDATDISLRRPTILVAEAADRLEGDEKAELLHIWESGGEVAIEKIRSLIEDSGAPQALLASAGELIDRAKAVVGGGETDLREGPCRLLAAAADALLASAQDLLPGAR